MTNRIQKTNLVSHQEQAYLYKSMLLCVFTLNISNISLLIRFTLQCFVKCQSHGSDLVFYLVPTTMKQLWTIMELIQEGHQHTDHQSQCQHTPD